MKMLEQKEVWFHGTRYLVRKVGAARVKVQVNRAKKGLWGISYFSDEIERKVNTSGTYVIFDHWGKYLVRTSSLKLWLSHYRRQALDKLVK